MFTDRLKNSLIFWIELGTPQWLLEFIDTGITIPFADPPPRMFCNNNVTVLDPNNVGTVRNIIKEYLAYGFVEEVNFMPYCVLPLQLKVTADKSALIYDMLKLNL